MILFLSKICLAQGVIKKYPVFFDQYFSCLSLINPSTSGMEYNYEFNTGHQRVLGNFSKLSTNYFIFNKRLKDHNITTYPFSSIGLYLYNDREGQYLNRGRMYLLYAWHGRLTYNYNFSGGLKVGAVNYLVKGTPLSGDGAAYNADGGVGISIYDNKMYFGICIDQIFNTELQPIDEITMLASFLTVNTYRKININDQLTITPYLLSRIVFDRDYNEDIYHFNLLFDYKQKIFFSGGYRSRFGLVFMAGTKNISLAGGSFTLGVSYLVPTKRSSLNINTLELNMGLTLKKIK